MSISSESDSISITADQLEQISNRLYLLALCINDLKDSLSSPAPGADPEKEDDALRAVIEFWGRTQQLARKMESVPSQAEKKSEREEKPEVLIQAVTKLHNDILQAGKNLSKRNEQKLNKALRDLLKKYMIYRIQHRA